MSREIRPLTKKEWKDFNTTCFPCHKEMRLVREFKYTRRYVCDSCRYKESIKAWKSKRTTVEEHSPTPPKPLTEVRESE